MIFKEIEYKDSSKFDKIGWVDWEEVPQEELWEDGEIDENGLTLKLFQRIITEGDWIVIRRNK